MEIAFTLPVDPMSIQFAGKRVMVRGGRPVFFKQKRASDWDTQIARLSAPYLPAQPFAGALYMEVTFVIRRPKALMGKRHPDGRIAHTKRPDIDNLQKGLQDALKAFWVDDSQIADLHLTKWYAAKDEEPSIRVRIQPI